MIEQQHINTAIEALTRWRKEVEPHGELTQNVVRQIDAACEALHQQQYVPVESGEVYFDFYIGTTADGQVRIRKVDALDRVTNDFVTLPKGWTISRLAAQEQEGNGGK